MKNKIKIIIKKHINIINNIILIIISFIGMVLIIYFGGKKTIIENNKVIEKNYFNNTIIKTYEIDEYLKLHKNENQDMLLKKLNSKENNVSNIQNR